MTLSFVKWLRRGWLPALGMVVACSGEAVVDDGGGGSGGTTPTTTSTSSGTTSTTSGTTSSTTSGTTSTSTSSGSGGCGPLTAEYEETLAVARACNACSDGPDPCEYLSGPQLTDPCGCPVSVNATDPDAVQAALTAYQQWVDAGCGPYPCGQPCAISNDPTCQSTGGSCDGQCAP
jgi:hypothetical protein